MASIKSLLGSIRKSWKNNLGDRPPVFITLFECDEETREKAIAKHSKVTFYRPIFVTTSPDVGTFLASAQVFEHFQSAEQLAKHEAAGGWSDYLEARWQGVLGKWRPRWIINKGLTFNEYLNKIDSRGSF